MVKRHIDHNHEVYEVVNAFPFLNDEFDKAGFSPDEIREGESVYDFFKNRGFTLDEVEHMIKKLNRRVFSHLNKSSGVYT